MVERLIKPCKARIARLEAQMENEALSPGDAERLWDDYEKEHWLLGELTGDKGDRRPEN